MVPVLYWRANKFSFIQTYAFNKRIGNALGDFVSHTNNWYSLKFILYKYCYTVLVQYFCAVCCICCHIFLLHFSIVNDHRRGGLSLWFVLKFSASLSLETHFTTYCVKYWHFDRAAFRTFSSLEELRKKYFQRNPFLWKHVHARKRRWWGSQFSYCWVTSKTTYCKQLL